MKIKANLFILVLSLILINTSIPDAQAQMPGEYCYRACFGSLQEAENEMRSALSYGAYLTKDKTIVTEGDSETPAYQIQYRVERQPPSQMSAPGYLVGGHGSNDTGCAANNDPFLKDYCTNEDEVIQNLMTYVRTSLPDCTISSERVEGAYGEPYVQSIPHYEGKGYLSFDAPGGKWLKYNLSCPGWSDPSPSPQQRMLVKRQIYSCPAGLYPVNAFNPAYNFTGNPGATADYPFL
ncbi:hypothetical protein [Xanthomonas axonopodis]|uniref:hypothetical protein n=1 Tax=Xanthomonas axonopodis TaxID=53413 RepID=UPI000A8EE87B|nr:hypothetical protein [Xanthomonas axonopodis]